MVIKIALCLESGSCLTDADQLSQVVCLENRVYKPICLEFVWRVQAVCLEIVWRVLTPVWSHRPRHTNGHHEELAVYLEAEEHGQLGTDCAARYSSCPISLFTMVAPGSVQYDS